MDSWKVANIDYSENNNAHLNIRLNKGKDFSKEIDGIEVILGGFSKQFEAIICTSEIYKTDSLSNKSIFNQYKEIDEINVQTSLLGKVNAKENSIY